MASAVETVEPDLVSLVGSYQDLSRLTGVRSRLSSSVAEAAASMRSSQRFPIMAAAVCGSAENAFLS